MFVALDSHRARREVMEMIVRDDVSASFRPHARRVGVHSEARIADIVGIDDDSRRCDIASVAAFKLHRAMSERAESATAHDNIAATLCDKAFTSEISHRAILEDDIFRACQFDSVVAPAAEDYPLETQIRGLLQLQYRSPQNRKFISLRWFPA